MSPKLSLPYRTDGGNMIVIDKGSDFEMYSSTSKGAIQAYGYVFHAGNGMNQSWCAFLIVHKTKNTELESFV
jgi:hypothetical protein